MHLSAPALLTMTCGWPSCPRGLHRVGAASVPAPGHPINGDHDMFLDCPAYRDQDGALRCGLPAEVRCRFTMHSTDGPVESAMIRCPAGHYFCGAIESLTWAGQDKHDPGRAAVTSRAGRDSVPGRRNGRDRTDGSAVRHPSAEAERTHRRPNTAPAYYLGHPAAVWITVMRPTRSPRRENPCSGVDRREPASAA